ncbi:hypothetical protein AVEN_135528-1 [Araneus ventricosus]|uniref:Uncharacterized protein n=1 Tax=Araneus ventricosus TaxID=182803 RepID=A0A4Y2HEC0_ARAVE|nr:hypothetical protein AVEN_135528-1 [Araneus ventricosus]
MKPDNKILRRANIWLGARLSTETSHVCKPYKIWGECLEEGVSEAYVDSSESRGITEITKTVWARREQISTAVSLSDKKERQVSGQKKFF